MTHLGTPINVLDPRVKTAWRMQSALALAVPVVAELVFAGFAGLLGLPVWVPVAVVALVIAEVVTSVVIVPPVRYRRWRWEVRDEEVRLQEGLLIVTNTVVPMVRIQHVDTAQGPIMRSLGLTDVHVWTAAGKHVIPALTNEHAAQLRDRIATLARVTDDGGL